MSSAEFAALIGVTRQAVDLWRRGLRMPAPEQAARIRKATRGRVTEADLRDAHRKTRRKDYAHAR